MLLYRVRKVLALLVVTVLSKNATAGSLTLEEAKRLTVLFENSEFKKIAKKIPFNFNGISQDFAKTFIACNEIIYPNHPEHTKLIQVMIQEQLYGFPRVVDIGLPYKLVKDAIDYPAMNDGISDVFISMAQPTVTQKKIFKESYNLFNKRFKADYSDKFEKLVMNPTNKLVDRYGKFGKDFRNKLSDNELKEWGLAFSILGCVYSDTYLSLYDFSRVGEFDTKSRKAAMSMTKSIQNRAIASLKRQANSNL